MQEPAGDAAGPVTETRPRSGWGQTFHALRYRNFRLLWVSSMMTAGGIWLQQVSLGWLAYDLTESPFQVGAILGTRSAPLLLAPITGVLADRLDRRKTLMVNQTLVTIWVLVFSVLLFTGRQQVWHLYVFALVFGVLWSVNNPLRQALVANAVPREVLMNAIALNSAAFNGMRAIGPAVGGLFIAFFGPGVNFLIQGIMFSFIVLLLLPFRADYATGDPELARSRSLLHNLVDGFAYVLTDQTMRLLLALTFLLTFSILGVIFTMLPVYTPEVLGESEGDALGFLFGMLGVGGLIGTLLIARFSGIERKGAQTMLAFAGAALSLIALSQVTVIWMAAIVLIFHQLFVQTVMTTNMTVIQSKTPDEMRGRVIGVYQMEIGLMPISGITAGALASLFGVANALLIGGGVGLGAVVLFAVLAPELRRIRA